MPLVQLADEITRLSDAGRTTPVLVTPSYLSLRRVFFAELVDALSQRTHRGIRIDWYLSADPGLLPLLRRLRAKWRADAINRFLRRRFETSNREIAIQVTASVARPGANDPLVLGLCDQRLELSHWTTPIQLGSCPVSLGNLQLT